MFVRADSAIQKSKASGCVDGSIGVALQFCYFVLGVLHAPVTATEPFFGAVVARRVCFLCSACMPLLLAVSTKNRPVDAPICYYRPSTPPCRAPPVPSSVALVCRLHERPKLSLRLPSPRRHSIMQQRAAAAGGRGPSWRRERGGRTRASNAFGSFISNTRRSECAPASNGTRWVSCCRSRLVGI